MTAKQSTHIRLPERSEVVAGPEKIPGQPPKIHLSPTHARPAKTRF